MDLVPRDIYKDLVCHGEHWAETNYAADLLEETRKTLVSKLANEANETSAVAKENYALRHPDYAEHIKKMTDARRIANRAKVQYDSIKVLAELLRTQAATERQANKYAT